MHGWQLLGLMWAVSELQVFPQGSEIQSNSQCPTYRATALQMQDSGATCPGILKGTDTDKGTHLGMCLGGPWDGTG